MIPPFVRVRSVIAFAVLATCVAATGAAARATWQPADVRRSDQTLQRALDRLHAADAAAGFAHGSFRSRAHVVAGRLALDVDVRVRDADYAITNSLANHVVRIGRAHGERWRQNLSGTVRFIRADVQGDDFDRWPVAWLGFDLADCRLAGIARVPQHAWVIEDRPALDITRWLYVDMASGDIVREVSLEGARRETYTFSDFRGDPPKRKPFAWHLEGSGGPEDVTVVERVAADVAKAEVAVPPQGPPVFSQPERARTLSVAVRYGWRFVVHARVDDAARDLILDSGTPMLALSRSNTQAAGGAPFGFGDASSMNVDDQRAHDVAFSPEDLDGFGVDGLLGYDFFRGRIVHVDFRSGSVETIRRDAFVPPAGALVLPTDWREGVPLVGATIGSYYGSRFILDLGSRWLLLTHAFVSAAGDAAGVTTGAPVRGGIRYLEGHLSILDGSVDSIHVGPVDLRKFRAYVEDDDAQNVGFPVDGIIGTDELAHFEWWFDADGPATYFRPV